MSRFDVARHFVGVILLSFISACNDGSDATPAVPPEAAVTVETLQLQSQPWHYTIESFGQLNVADTVRIGIESPGTIKQVNLLEGQPVTAGQLLFKLDNNKQQLRLEQSKAAVREAETQLQQLQKTYSRFSRLRTDGAASEDQLQQAKTNYESAIARLQQAQAALDIAQAELNERHVISPVDGVLERESVEIGQYVQPGETLAVIQADGALQVKAHVNENEVVQMAVGQQAFVTVAGAEYKALIESVGRTAKPQTGNYEIKLRIQDHGSQLREGMSARVSLAVTSSQPVLLVPRSAVVDRDRKRVVYVVEEGKASVRTVQFGLPDSEFLPVIAGLQSGDQLIVSPMALITDGTAVSFAVSTPDNAAVSTPVTAAQDQ